MKHIKKITAILLSALLILSVFAGCGGKGDDSEMIKITLPAATQAEQAVNVTASLAVNSYLCARAYLDLFLDYDVQNMSEADAKAFVQTLKNAITTFEDADKLSSALVEATDVWEKMTDDEKPVMTSLRMNLFSLGLTAHAAADSGAKKWAQDLVDAYDKAPAGKGIRTLADQLGTDSKHAYAQLKQALAVLEGAEYTEIADKANTAVKVATGLKAAGTAAGLVIAVAAAPAAGTLGAVAKTGGVVCSGINTVLEVGSAGSIIYNNGEENEISIACDKTEAQFAPIGQIFSIMGLGLALKDVGKTGKQIIDNGYKSLSAKDKADLGDNMFGILSYAASSVNDYVNGGSILSGTFTKTDKGVEFTLKDTLLGTEKEATDEIKQTLKDAGIDSATVDGAFDGNETAKPDGNIPKEVAENIINNNFEVAPDSGLNVDDFITGLESALIEIAAKGERDAASDETTKDASPATQGKWVDPYEYFGVNDIVALYPLLNEAKPLKLEVTPICFDNNDRHLIEFSNTDTFIIDLSEGAETKYTTSYVNGFDRFELTLTFTGYPSTSDFIKIRSDVDCYVASNGNFQEHRVNDDCIVPQYSLDPHAPFADKALDFDNYTTASIALRIERVLLPD